MSLPDYISQADAARCAGVQRRTIYDWLQASRLKLDSQGRILRADFEREHAGHVLVSRLRDTIAALPAHQLPSILIEILGSGYLRALGNLVGEKSSTSKRPGEMRSDAPR
jgi:hypothetical protein